MRVADTTVTDVYGVGPIVAAYLIGYTGDITRFATKDRYARYNATAPLEASSGPKPRHRLNDRGNRQLNHALHIAAVTQISHDTAGRDYYLRKQAEGQTTKKQSARSSDASATPSTTNCTPTRPAEPARAREGNQGRLFNPAWPAESLNTGTSEQPLPNPNNNATTDTPSRHGATPRPKRPTNSPLTQTGFARERRSPSFEERLASPRSGGVELTPRVQVQIGRSCP